jgi:X-X-X-Leu-X-X-Gly heptad repeat protein
MKKLASLLLSIILILTLTAASAVSQANEEQALIKDETVYANLNADGSIGQIYVVNRIETPKKGVYTDYGHYTSVLNLSGSQQPGIAGDEIRWQKADEVLYYQGQLAQGELPFTYALDYKLNGVSVTPQEAIGKSGTIAIAIAVQPNEKAKAYFRGNYVAQIQIPLNLETASNVLAPGAVSVITGKTANLAYTVLPGQKASFTLQFDTDKFELDPITFACTPFDTSSFLSGDTAEIKSGLSQLTGGLDQLVAGSKKLKKGLTELNSGLGRLSTGASELAAGISKIAESGAQGLQQGALELDDGVGQLAQGAAGLAAGASDLSEGISGYTAAAGQIHENAQLLNTGLAQLGSEGESLSTGYQQLTAGLSGAFAELPAQLAALELTPEQQQALGQILGGVAAELETQMSGFGQGLQEYTAGVSQSAQGVGELTLGLEAFAGQGQNLNAGASQLASGSAGFSQGLADLKVGSSSLAAGLTIFADQSQDYDSGTLNLSAGANALAEGLQEMANRTGRLPGDVQSLIDGQSQIKEGFLEAGGILADFELPEGKEQPVSFVSDKVTPRSVQFIASTPALKVKTEEAKEPAESTEKASFFTRLLKLFKIND